jgi:hypothetical protein
MSMNQDGTIEETKKKSYWGNLVPKIIVENVIKLGF